MANVKITDLPVYASITSPSNDVLPIVDTTTNLTKKVTVSTLLAGAIGTGTVTNVSIAGSLSSALSVSNPTITPAISIINAATPTTQFLRGDGTWAVPPGGSGGITSIALAAPNTFTVTGSPLTSNGTITLGWGTGTVPIANLGSGTPTATTFLNGTGQWSIPNAINFIGLTLPNTFSVVNAPLTANGTIQVTWAVPSGSVGLVPVANLGTGAPSATTYLSGTGQWTVPSGTGTGLTSVGLSMPNAFTVSSSPLTTNGTLGVTWGSGTVPVVNLGTGTASGTTFLRGDGSWAVPSGSGGTSPGNIDTGLNIYNSTTAGTGLMGIDLTTNPATVTLTAPSTVGLNGTWTLSAALPAGYTSGDLVIFASSDRAVVGIGTYTVTAAPAFTIIGVIYDPNTSSPTASTIYTNVIIKRGVSIASGSAGAVGTWLTGTTAPTSGTGSVGQYYSQSQTYGFNYLSYVKTDNTTWTAQPNLDRYVQSQAIQGALNFGLQFPNFEPTPVLGVRITPTANTNTNPTIRAVNLAAPDTNDYTLALSGQNRGGIALGDSTGTCPLLAADSAYGVVGLNPGIGPSVTPQCLFSSGTNRTPHWSDATAYSTTFINGNGYSWTYQFTIGTSGTNNSVTFTNLPYITTIPTLASSPATITAPSGGFVDFTTFANAFVAYINAENLALQMTASIDTVNHLITITTSVPTGLVSPNPPTSASVLPTLASTPGQYVTSVVIQGSPTAATLASKEWVISPTYLAALETQLGNDFGFDNYAYLLLAGSRYTALTTTFTWSASQGRNTLILNGNFTKIGRGFEITFDNTGGGPIYNVRDVTVSQNQGVFTTTVLIYQTFSANYSNVANTIYQLHGRTTSYTSSPVSNPPSVTVPWTMFSSNLGHLTYTGAYSDASNGQYTFYSTSGSIRRFTVSYWFNFNSTGNVNPNAQSWIDIYNPLVDSGTGYRTAYTSRGSFSNDNYNLIMNNSWTLILGPYGSFNIRLRSTSNGTIGANIVTTPTPFEDAVFPVVPGTPSSYGGLMTITEV